MGNIGALIVAGFVKYVAANPAVLEDLINQVLPLIVKAIVDAVQAAQTQAQSK